MPIWLLEWGYGTKIVKSLKDTKASKQYRSPVNDHGLFGVRAQAHHFLPVLTIFVAFLGNGCSNRTPQIESSDVDNLLEITDDDAVMFEEEIEGLSDTPPALTIHPRDNTRKSLKELIMTSNMPPQDELAQCRTEVLALSDESLNDFDLVKYQEQIYQAAQQAKTVYHWCFYQNLNLLDERLISDQLNQSHDARMNDFHRTMKALWILAIALDRAVQEERYFPYIRKMYLRYSEDVFGRRLKIISEPFNRQDLKPVMNKPAGESGF